MDTPLRRVEKAFLRYTAIRSGLPMEIALRGKKAAQYGSGVQKILRKVNP